MRQDLGRKLMVSQPPLRCPDLHPNLGSATSDLHADLHPCGKCGWDDATVREHKSRGWENSRKRVGREALAKSPEILRGWFDIKDYLMETSYGAFLWGFRPFQSSLLFSCDLPQNFRPFSRHQSDVCSMSAPRKDHRGNAINESMIKRMNTADSLTNTTVMFYTLGLSLQKANQFSEEYAAPTMRFRLPT